MPRRVNGSLSARKKTCTQRHAAYATLVVYLLLCSCVLSARAQQDVLPQLDGSIQSAALKRRPASSSANVMGAPDDINKARIAPGYLLRMEVYDTPEMDTELRVDPAGRVSVPLAGAVAVAGQTLPEAQAAIAKAFVDEQILKAPQVTLNLLQYASESATVLGEVQSPGRIPLLAPKALGDVLAEAGGETFSAGPAIDVLHTASDGTVRENHVHYQPELSSQAMHAVVFPGDMVIVHRAGAVYVLGGVTRPGAYLMVHNGSLNVLEAIALAQGTLLRASTGEIEVLRYNGETYARLTVPLKKVQKGQVAPPQLLANDIVYVPMSAAKSVFLDGTTLLGAAATASIYAIH